MELGACSDEYHFEYLSDIPQNEITNISSDNTDHVYVCLEQFRRRR